MQNKKSRIIKIVTSIGISIVLVFILFLRYNSIITNNYIEQTKKEAEQNSYSNSKLFLTKIKSTKEELEILRELYFSNVKEIPEDVKNQFLQKTSQYSTKFSVYSIEEFKKANDLGKCKLFELNKFGVTIGYISNTKGEVSKIEISVPIKYNNSIIGVLSQEIPEEEFHNINEYENSFNSYIFKKDGIIVFGKDHLKNKNIYSILQEANIKDDLSVVDIKLKIANKETFSFIAAINSAPHYLFFKPIYNNVYTLEIIPLSYSNKIILETNKLVFSTLIQVVLIIILQIAYLCWGIAKQYKDLSQIEIERTKETQGLINSVPGGVIKILFNENLEIIFANSGFYNLTGYSAEEFNQNFNNFQKCIIFEEDLINFTNKITYNLLNKNRINFEYRIIKKDGEISWLSLTGEYLNEENGFPIYQCIVIDSTDYKSIIEAFIIEKEQYKIISEISEEIIFEYDIKNDFIQLSEKYKETFPVGIVNRPFLKWIISNKIIHKDDLSSFITNIRSVSNGDAVFADEIRIKNNFGEYNWAFYQGVAIKNSTGTIYKIVGKISNIDKFKREIEELKEKSIRDPLTKVYNKTAIEDIVNSFISQNKEAKCALFIIDVDNFKSVNDTFGHIFGDSVLKESIKYIKSVFNENEIVARIGGDEFVVFIKDMPDFDYAKSKAELICKVFRQSYMNNNEEYKISASVGVVLTPQHGLDYSTLIQKADIAVYSAKNEGKDNYKVYDKNMKEISILDVREEKNSKNNEQLLLYHFENNTYFNSDFKNSLNQSIIENQQLYTYVVEKYTYKILFYNEKIKEIIPNVKIGEVCFKAKGYKSPCYKCPLNKLSEKAKRTRTKFYSEVTNGWYAVTSSIINLFDQKEAYLLCYRDISQFIEQINYVDSLTKAPSIAKFNISAANILNNKVDEKYAILYMDIDKFKYINDTFGYKKGSEFLKAFALFLKNNLDKEDIFCRVNDDRFLALVKFDDNYHFNEKLKTIFKRLDKMNKKHFKEINIIITCGAYIISDTDNDLNTVIDRANIARKSIKGSHKSFFAVYTEKMNDILLKEKFIEGRMKFAIENNEFLVYLQPKFKLNTLEICGAEALVRWVQPNGEIIYPNDFIPIFEKNGFIIELDFYIYERIFRKIREWINSNLKIVPIALNVSRLHINNIGFVDRIIKLIDKYQIPYDLVEIELTESIFSEDIKNLNYIMSTLKEKGLKLSIDDFGSAYSSLNLLKDINADIIKIDKTFLQNHAALSSNKSFEKEKIIVEHIVKMAKEIGLDIICEGIETQDQIDFLKSIGCEIGQGYIFSRPIQIAEFENLFLY